MERAITDIVGAPLATDGLRVMLRIDDDLATISMDTSGEGLHKRGSKQFTGKAPLRETMAAGFLRQMGYDGSQPVLDPMCGSGTFLLEAAEIAAGLAPGRGRDFAFEHFAGAAKLHPVPPVSRNARATLFRLLTSDQKASIHRPRSAKIAERAGLEDLCEFTLPASSAHLTRPPIALNGGGWSL